MKLIPYGKQYLDYRDLDGLKNALFEDFLTTGKRVNKLEDAIKKFTTSKYCLSCNSGTSALYLAFKSLNITSKDNVIIPSINFVASCNMLKILGANVFLADVDKHTGQMRPIDVLSCIRNNKLKKIKAIVTMYLGGEPDNIGGFYNLKKKLNFKIIEDACHALGSKYKYKNKTYRIGSCKHSDISVFSMHPVKTITSGEGGLITTNSKEIYRRSVLIRSHGIKRNINHFHYDVTETGMNFRLSDINCMLAITQLKKINKFVKRRNQLRSIYNNLLSNNRFLLNKNYNSESILSACHLYQIQLNLKSLKVNRDKIIKELLKKRIVTQIHYIPIYKHSIYKKLYKGNLKNSEFFYKSTLSLPIFFKLKNSEVSYICKTLNYVLKKFEKK